MGKARRERERLRAEPTSYAVVPIMANWNEIGAGRERAAELAKRQAGDRARSGVSWRQWPASEVGAILPALFPDPNDYEQKLIDNAMNYMGAFPDSMLIVAEIQVAMPAGAPLRHVITTDDDHIAPLGAPRPTAT